MAYKNKQKLFNIFRNMLINEYQDFLLTLILKRGNNMYFNKKTSRSIIMELKSKNGNKRINTIISLVEDCSVLLLRLLGSWQEDRL